MSLPVVQNQVSTKDRKIDINDKHFSHSGRFQNVMPCGTIYGDFPYGISGTIFLQNTCTAVGGRGRAGRGGKKPIPPECDPVLDNKMSHYVLCKKNIIIVRT